MPRGWFGPRVLGWGWGPRSWQVWLLIVVFLVAGWAVGLVPGLAMDAVNGVRVGLLVLFLAIVVLTYQRRPR